MIKVYEKYQCSIVAIEEVPMEETKKYGVIAGNLVDGTNNTYRVTDMVEKPDPKDAPTNMAIIGRYILPKISLTSFAIQNQVKAERSRLPMPYSNRQNKAKSSLTNLTGNVLIVGPLMDLLRLQIIFTVKYNTKRYSTLDIIT